MKCVIAANIVCYSCLLHLKHHTFKNNYRLHKHLCRILDLGHRESQQSRTKQYVKFNKILTRSQIDLQMVLEGCTEVDLSCTEVELICNDPSNIHQCQFKKPNHRLQVNHRQPIVQGGRFRAKTAHYKLSGRFGATCDRTDAQC